LRRGFWVFAVVFALVAGGCVFARPTDEAVSGPLFDHPTFAEAGPYEVGVTTLELDDREVEVWYPADRGAVVGRQPDTYFIRDFTSPTVQALIPPDINPPFVTDAYRDVRAARRRPFPVVLFSHGAVSFRMQSTFLTTHLASWGFVVASPDFLERGLQSFLGPQPPIPKSSVQVLDETVARLEGEHVRRGGRLQGRLDLGTVLPIGHSAGGFASSQYVAANGAPAWSAMASPAADPTGPGSSGLWMAGADDQVAELERVVTAFDAARGPKRLVVIEGAGHNNAFSDICEIGASGGGVIALAREAGLPIPDDLARLGEDGCLDPNLPSEQVWPVARHFVTAHLRFQAGISSVPWGLGDGVADRFEAPVSYTQVGESR
jgi:dienelactone hydrolase